MAQSNNTPSRGKGGRPNNSKPLSDKAIRGLKSGQTITDIGENRGLRVIRGKSGITTFFYRYRSPITNEKGQHPIRQYKIGAYPELSLHRAREELSQLKAKRDSGICPAAEKSNERAVKVQQQAVESEVKKQEAYTVEKCIEYYLAEQIEAKKAPDGTIIRKGNRKPKGQKEVRRLLYADPAKELGNIPVIDLTSEQVVNMVMGVVARGSNVVAGSMLRELTAAIDFSIGTDLPATYQNPCYQAKGLLKRKRVRLSSVRGRRVLNDGELASLLKWLPGSKYTPTQKNVLQFTLMTGCRTGEACNAVWKDFDLEKGTWHLRETKTGSERYVQLSRQAVAFLEQLKKTTGDYPFPSQKTGLPLQQKQLTEQAWRMRRDKTFIDLPKWTPHDLRRSVRTGLARLGCRTEVAEAVLGHSRSGVEGTYDLYSYEAECREWLQKWCDHIDVLLASDNVVSIGAGV